MNNNKNFFKNCIELHTEVLVKWESIRSVHCIIVSILFSILYSFAKYFHWGEAEKMYIGIFLLSLTTACEFTGISITFQLETVYCSSRPHRVQYL